MTPGIVCALRAEARTLSAQHLEQGQSVRLPNDALLMLSGIGRKRAGAAAEKLLRAGANAILSWGIAGALDPRLEPGALLLPKTVIAANGPPVAVHSQWHNMLHESLTEAFSVRTEALAEAADVMTSPDQKRDAYRQTAAIATDMESAALAEAAQRAGVPFAAVRVISDTLDMTLPARVSTAVNPIGDLPLHALISHVVLRPQDWPSLARLALGLRAATHTLRHVAGFMEEKLLLAA